MKKVLFVCAGNICRSPAGQAILRHYLIRDGIENIHVDSSGIVAWEACEAHPAIVEVLKQRGIPISTHRSKPFKPSFLKEFDYILVTDHEILHAVQRQVESPQQLEKIHLICAFSEAFSNRDIPDPFDGGPVAFERVADMLEDACEGFLKHLRTGQE